MQPGEAFDVVVLASPALAALAAEGFVTVGTRADVARSEMMAAVPAGRPRPALAVEADLAAALEGHLLQAPPGVPVAALLAEGRADLGFQQGSELVGQPGIALLGPQPPGCGATTVCAAGVCACCLDAEAARGFVASLAGPTPRRRSAGTGWSPPDGREDSVYGPRCRGPLKARRGTEAPCGSTFSGSKPSWAWPIWGSFSRAAGHLNLSQTALSHRLKKLEGDLGVKLLSRTTRQVTLTAAGLELLPRAQRAVEELGASLDGLRAVGRGRRERLAIGCLPTIANHHLPRVLGTFEHLHPGVALRIFDNSASEIVERVMAGEAEFGVTIVSTGRWDLDITPLLKEPFVVVCPAGHPLAAGPAAAWGDLAGVPLIRISQQTGNRALIDDALGARRELMTWRYEVQHVATALGMVQAGVGLTVVPRLGVDLADDPGLAAVALRNPGVVRTIGLVARRSEPLSPAAECLAGLIGARLREG